MGFAEHIGEDYEMANGEAFCIPSKQHRDEWEEVNY